MPDKTKKKLSIESIIAIIIAVGGTMFGVFNYVTGPTQKLNALTEKVVQHISETEKNIEKIYVVLEDHEKRIVAREKDAAVKAAEIVFINKQIEKQNATLDLANSLIESLIRNSD